MFRRASLAFAALIAATPASFALTITGAGEVLDSDLIRVNGYRLYLFGVESVEFGQGCEIRGQLWDCFPAAVRALQTIVAEGPLTCDILSGPNFLDEAIARCMVNGQDVAERLVRAGFAVAIPSETDAYVAAMNDAQARAVGLWQGPFAPPAEWRAAAGILADRPAYRPETAAP
jgi:endonuclease YncB( thermonuclease family)